MGFSTTRKKVFLGGTCNGSTWRGTLIGMLDIENIDYYNPVVKDWTIECMAEEIHQRQTCDFVLYVITPLMTGVYSIAEAVDDSNKRPEKTLFCYLDTIEEGGVCFPRHQIKSLEQVAKMVADNGGVVFPALKDVAEFLNDCGDSCNDS